MDPVSICDDREHIGSVDCDPDIAVMAKRIMWTCTQEFHKVELCLMHMDLSCIEFGEIQQIINEVGKSVHLCVDCLACILLVFIHRSEVT